MSGEGDRTRHRDVVRASFEKQAEEFSRSPVIADEARLTALLRWARLSGRERVLDVACGPGLVTAAFAERARARGVGVRVRDVDVERLPRPPGRRLEVLAVQRDDGRPDRAGGERNQGVEERSRTLRLS